MNSDDKIEELIKQPKHYIRIGLGRDIHTILKIALEEPIGNLLNQRTAIERATKMARCQPIEAKKNKEALNYQWSDLPKAMLLCVDSQKKFHA